MVKQVLEQVPIDTIEVRLQVRRSFDEEGIAGLAASIRSEGLLHPLLCRREGAQLVLVDGERRYRACRSLGLTSVPVLILEEGMQPAEALAVQLVTNLQRADLNPLERAEGLQSLMRECGLTAEQAAKRLGMSQAAVTRALAILKLPGDLQAQVATGAIAPDAAYQLSRVQEPERQAQLAGQVASGTITRDALAKQLRKAPKSGNSKGRGGRRVSLPAGADRVILLSGAGWGRDLTLEELVASLEKLAARGRKAHRQGITLATFVRALADQASA